MTRPADQEPYEQQQQELDPHRREQRQRAMAETSDRLRDRGVAVTGNESSEELVSLLEAVERFEDAVESRGGDLMIDEGPGGSTREPEDVHFVLPRRGAYESVASYLGRVEDATHALRHHPRR